MWVLFGTVLSVTMTIKDWCAWWNISVMNRTCGERVPMYWQFSVLPFHRGRVSFGAAHGECACILSVTSQSLNGRYFGDSIFICILIEQNVWKRRWNVIEICFGGPLNTKPSLFQVMAFLKGYFLRSMLNVAILYHFCFLQVPNEEGTCL